MSTFIVVRYKKLTCINNRGQKGKFTVYEFTSCHIEFDRSLYYTNTIKIIPIRVNPSLPIAITISSPRQVNPRRRRIMSTKTRSSPLSPEVKFEPSITDIQTKETAESLIRESMRNVQLFMDNNNNNNSSSVISMSSRLNDNRTRYKDSKETK